MSKNFKLNLPGLNALMKSLEMQNILNGHAQRLAASAGDGYEAVIERAHPISFIAIASVRTGTNRARRDNAKNNTLEKLR